MRAADWSPEKLIKFVDKIAELHDAGKLPFAIHLPGGNETQLIDIFKDIKSCDYVLSTHRNCYHALLHGIPPEELEEKILSAKSMFVFDRARNFLVSAIIGGTVAIAVGLAWALKKKNIDRRVWCFIGDGTEDSGHFYEAVRYVNGFDLPCTFVIEDDGMAVEAPKEVRWGTSRDTIWPNCVLRYHYRKTRPHIRTGRFADTKIMRAVMRSDQEYFPNVLRESYIEPESFSKTGLNYRDAVTEAMKKLGTEDTIFIGYSLLPGDAMGTLKHVNNDQKIEMPVAENLMVGFAIGLSIEGFKPVVYFERHDFMLVALDAIVNHVDKIERISHGEFKVKIIFKTVVDDGGLFYSGPTHSQNFTEAFRKMLSFPVIDPHCPDGILDAYRFASKTDGPVMVVEHKAYF